MSSPLPIVMLYLETFVFLFLKMIYFVTNLIPLGCCNIYLFLRGATGSTLILVSNAKMSVYDVFKLRIKLLNLSLVCLSAKGKKSPKFKTH